MGSHTRERIMEAALQLFAEQGVAATPITAIEAAAGLSPGSGSFYRHFKDKGQLLSAVVQREIIRVKKDPAAQVTHAPADMPADEALAIQLLADFDFLRDLLPLMAILMWERGRDRDDVRHGRLLPQQRVLRPAGGRRQPRAVHPDAVEVAGRLRFVGGMTTLSLAACYCRCLRANRPRDRMASVLIVGARFAGIGMAIGTAFGRIAGEEAARCAA